MFGISSERALSQARILLILAMIWLLMALITKKHRTFTVIIYAGIGVLFELFGLYNIWISLVVFSLSKIVSYLIIALLFLLFIVLMAAVWVRYQGSPSSASTNLSINSPKTEENEDCTDPGQAPMTDFLSGYAKKEDDPGDGNCV